jgi:polyisoprenoid-binding protein YceI
MKKECLFHALAGVLFCFMALAKCTSDGGNNRIATKAPDIPIETTSTLPNLDTIAMALDTSAMKEPSIAQKTAAPKSKTLSIKAQKTKAVAKATSSKPKSTPKPLPTAAAEKLPTPTVEKEPTAAAEKLPIPTAEKVPTTAAQTMSGEFSLKSVKAVVLGTSSLHDWESKVTKMEGEGAFNTKNNELVSIKDVEIKIAVKGIKSKEGKKMDDKTYETFNSDKNPNIVYTISNAIVKIDASHAVTIEATGQLAMAGVTQPVSLSAIGIELPNGDLQLSVSKKLKMTDFNMKPPVMMLGAIKVGDEITVKFDFVLEKTK